MGERFFTVPLGKVLRKKENRNGRSKKYEKKYVTYDGYNEELKLFSKNGICFRFFKLCAAWFDEEKIKGLFREKTFSYQVLCNRSGSYLLAGVKTEDPLSAAEELDRYEKENRELLTPQPSEAWFQYMSERLKGESFAGFPELIKDRDGKVKRKQKKETAVGKLQPYGLKKLQTKMEISGRETKTIILVNFPSRMFDAFTTELLKISDAITVSVFAEILNKEKCLEGMSLLKDMRPARRESMREYIEGHIKTETDLFNTGVLINITGNEGTIEEIYGKMVRYCKRYLISVNQLDYQQSDGFLSTLPLLENRIRYHRVMDLHDLKAFLPWSRLKDMEKNVSYGKNPAGEEVWYDRYLNHESGLIVSDDYGWCLNAVRKELTAELDKTPELADKVRIISVGPGSGTGFTLNILDPEESNVTVLKSALTHWAVGILSNGGRTLSRDVNSVLKAADHMVLGSEPDLKSCLDRFFTELPEEMGEKLKKERFQTVFRYSKEKDSLGTKICVEETGAFSEIAYTLLMNSMGSGYIVSLNSEFLQMPYGSPFKIREGTVYTFLSPDLRKFYEGDLLERLISKCTFFYLGEHHIAEKLRISGALGLTKEQRDMISAPARADVLITELCDFLLAADKKKEKEEMI